MKKALIVLAVLAVVAGLIYAFRGKLFPAKVTASTTTTTTDANKGDVVRTTTTRTATATRTSSNGDVLAKLRRVA